MQLDSHQSPDSPVEAVVAAAPVLPSGSPPNPAPRVWTVFVMPLLALAIVIAVQIAVVLGYVGWMTTQGADARQMNADELTRAFTTPLAFTLLGLASQAIFAAAALIPAKLSPAPFAERLSLRCRTPRWTCGVFAIGSLPVLALGIVVIMPLTRFLPSTGAGDLYAQMTWGAAIPFWLFVTMAPACAEELLFRGFIQTRLLQRWSPAVAIGVTSAMFAAFHMAPLQVIAVFPLGVWFGVIAWRTGSIWPGVLCHATVNGLWNIWQIGRRLSGWSDPPTWLAVVLGAIALACFGLGVLILVRRKETSGCTKTVAAGFGLNEVSR